MTTSTTTEQATHRPADRVRATMCATRVSFVWFGTRKSLTPQQRAQAAESFSAASDFLSAGKKLLDTRHPQFKAVTSIRSQARAYWASISLPFPETGIRLVRQDTLEAFQSQMADFKQQLAESIYENMRAERKRISPQYRSEGEEEQLKSKAETDKESAIILAEAKKQSQIIRGQGDAGAIKIYAEALQQDPEFYSFLKSLQIYRESLQEGTKVVLTNDSSLFQYLESPKLGKP